MSTNNAMDTLVQTQADILDFIAEEQLADFMGGSLPYQPKEEDEEEGENKETKDAGMVSA
jgi:hypothetical protein